AFISCIYYASIEVALEGNGDMLSLNEIYNIMKVDVKGNAKGKKIINDPILRGLLDLDINKDISSLYVKKYLQCCKLEYKNKEPIRLNTEENNILCNEIIKVMQKKNICFNSTITSKVTGVIYYLIQLKYGNNMLKKNKKYYSDVFKIGQDTFITIYNTLISVDVKNILVNEIPELSNKF